MNRVVKTILLLICAAFVFIFSGCEGETDETETNSFVSLQQDVAVINTKAEITAAYVGFDSINPYKAKSVINKELMYLLHAGLFQLESDLSVSCVIAQSYKADGNEVVVTIKDEAVFSDNTPILSSHVIQSLRAAKGSSLYSKMLSSVKSAQEISERKVLFTFDREDIFALNLLTFPIIKSNTDNPCGAGKYLLEFKGEKPYLRLNNRSLLYAMSQNNEISLYDVGLGENEQYAFITGKTSVYIDTLEDNEYHKLSSKTASIETTRLVFIGVNSKSGESSWTWLRRAVDIGLNRTKVAGAPLLGQSVPAATVFHPAFYGLEGIDITHSQGDKEAALRILEENGFSSENSSGFRKKGSLTLTLTVLVCNDNPLKVNLAKAFKEDMKELGIKINIDEQAPDKYSTKLKSGKFDLYIGEIMLCPNFALDSFFTREGSVSFGISEKSCENYFQFKKGKMSISNYLKNFSSEVPFIPVCYRRNVMSYDSTFEGVETAFDDPYYSVYSWGLSD
ncbi:MAG TPA: ABC transporter substrate-binding protein [Clostridiales bacterium]|jgi:peptide/nickel transport system substrate-binding protein|nr:ABC transporter substrate-binding protein [Clostridiales bacterium]